MDCDSYISTFLICTTIFNSIYLCILNSNINYLKNEINILTTKNTPPSYSV